MLKFPGIDLSPGALIMRKKADALSNQLLDYDKILADALAINAGTPEMRAAAGKQVEALKAEIARIEAQITTP